MSDSDDWMLLWIPINAEEAALGPAIADALVRAFGRVNPDDVVEFGSQTWYTGPLGDSVMCRLEVRLRKAAGHEVLPGGVFTSDPPPERAILTDLIADLRPLRRYDFIDQQLLAVPLDRAEARLREVTRDE